MLPSAVTSLFPGQKHQLTDNLPVPQDLGPDFIEPVVVYLASDMAARVTGQLIYSCGGDICVYGRPLQLPGPHVFARKQGRWTVEELNQFFPMSK